MSAEGIVPQFVKRLEARIALALAKVVAGETALAAAQNHSDSVLALSTSPATSATFSAPAFTSKSGKVRVLAWACIGANGGTMAAGDQISISLQRDGTQIPTTPDNMNGIAVVPTGAPAAGMQMSLGADDETGTPGSHTYSVHVVGSGGHTISLVGGSTGIILQEIP